MVDRHNFRLDIILYNIPNNINGKILFQLYINQIMKPVIKLMLFKKKNFILKEDNNSKQSKAENNNII